MENRSRVDLLNRESKQIHKNIDYVDKSSLEIIVRFRENMKNITKRFDLVEMLEKQEMYEEAYDILRFQIVYAMSALDFFMHEIYSYGLLKIFKNERPKTGRYNEYKIPLKLLEMALYNAENIDSYLKDEFIDINSGHTFMSSSRIREVLNIISHEDEFALAEKQLKKNKIIKDQMRLDHVLDHIYERRNKISHQTDINHGGVEKNKITKGEVEFYINVIYHLVEELYKLISTDKEKR